ncbi:MAG: alpha/beta hydrolase [Bacteroidia bacterium]|nr:alpha/beta hydrolase [Bacteroidia bacterium]
MNPEPFQVRRLHLSDRQELAYVDEGEGPALVMIHGLSSSLRIWDRNIAALRSRFRCIAVDLPGYGHSPRMQQPASLQGYALRVLELIYRLDLHRPVLAGHSMGGQIAMTAALRYPSTVSRLVLAAPAGFERFTRLQQAALRRSLQPAQIMALSDERILQNLKLSFYRYPEAARFMAEDRIALRSSPRLAEYALTVHESVLAMLREPVWHQLPQLAQPVLALFGEQDLLIPNRLFHPLGSSRRVAQAGAARIPDCRLVMIPECGHFVPFECPEVFNAHAADFAAD